jgi:16S rRNA (uracil1498-N3)-methyltransferase
MTHSIRIHLPHSPGEGTLSLSGEIHHYLVHVLRARPGAEVILFGESQVETVCVIDAIEDDCVHLRVSGRRESGTEPSSQITLCVAVGKGKKLEEIVEAVTALGVSRVIPFVGGHSVAQRSNPRLQERLKSIAVEACRQSRRVRIPEIHPVMPDLRSAIDRISDTTKTMFFLDERGGQELLGVAVGHDRDVPLVLFVGPEGGWTDAERELLACQGAQSVSLGPRILRTELAATVAVALAERAIR